MCQLSMQIWSKMQIHFTSLKQTEHEMDSYFSGGIFLQFIYNFSDVAAPSLIPIPIEVAYMRPSGFSLRSVRVCMRDYGTSLQWHHNGHDGVSNHQPHDCLLKRLFVRRSTKISNLRVTGFYAGNSPVTGEFPAQMASNAENVSICWPHHVMTFIG